jgi:hypothetical protein
MVTVFTAARVCDNPAKSPRSIDAAASIGAAIAASGASKERPSAVVTTKPAVDGATRVTTAPVSTRRPGVRSAASHTVCSPPSKP